MTFGDGVGKVVGKGNIDRYDAPILNDVRLVEGLSVNLISISQLCNQGFLVSFSKEKCEVLNQEKCIVRIDTQLSDNCYHWENVLKNFVCAIYQSLTK